MWLCGIQSHAAKRPSHSIVLQAGDGIYAPEELRAALKRGEAKEEYFGSLQELYNVKSFEPSRMVYDNINGEEKMFQLGKRWLNRIFALTKSFFKEICGGHDVVQQLLPEWNPPQTFQTYN